MTFLPLRTYEHVAAPRTWIAVNRLCLARKLHPGFLIRRIYAGRVYRGERVLVDGTTARCDGLHGEERRSLIQV